MNTTSDPLQKQSECQRCQQLEDQLLQAEQAAFERLQLFSETCQQLRQRCEHLEAVNQQLQQNQGALEASPQPAIAELAAAQGPDAQNQDRTQHQERQDDNELMLLQLKQLQEELATTFASLQRCRTESLERAQRVEQLQQQNQTLVDELQQLAQECRHLFLHSQLLASLDRRRIGRILALVRQSLQH